MINILGTERILSKFLFLEIVDSSCDESQYDNDDNYSYDKYNGAYGFDDDTIDSAFEGEPEAYWNID